MNKWDGFRCLAFVLPDQVVLQSRSEEDIAPTPSRKSSRWWNPSVGTVLDGSWPWCTPGAGFRCAVDPLAACSEVGGNIAVLAERHPAVLIGFDLLARPGEDLRGVGRGDGTWRFRTSTCPGHLPNPATRDADEARQWADVVAGRGSTASSPKPIDGTYEPGVQALSK